MNLRAAWSKGAVADLQRTAAQSIGMVAPVTGDDVLEAAELVEGTLEAHLGTDWTAAVPGLDFTVASVVAHAARAMLWYSIDLWSGSGDAAFEVQVRDGRAQ